MTKVNFSEVFKTFQGLPMRLSDVTITLQNILVTLDRFFNGQLDQEGLKAQLDLVIKENPPLQLKDVCLNSLANPKQEEKITATEKFRRGLLGHKIAEANELELPAEDIVLLKKVIDETYTSPLVVFNAFLLLDPTDSGTKEPPADEAPHKKRPA